LTLVDPISIKSVSARPTRWVTWKRFATKPPIQIGNRVWADNNCDGVQDPCEDPIEGVFVSLYSATTNALLATTTTNKFGEYYFTGLGTSGEKLDTDTGI
jgi:hypothetical protein